MERSKRKREGGGREREREREREKEVNNTLSPRSCSIISIHKNSAGAPDLGTILLIGQLCGIICSLYCSPSGGGFNVAGKAKLAVPVNCNSLYRDKYGGNAVTTHQRIRAKHKLETFQVVPSYVF